MYLNTWINSKRTRLLLPHTTCTFTANYRTRRYKKKKRDVTVLASTVACTSDQEYIPVARLPQAHYTTDYTQEAPTCTHTAAVCKSVPSKDSVSHLLERRYLIGAYTKRPSHILRYIRQSSNRTYITALRALPAIGCSRLFTNEMMGDHRPHRTEYNVCE